MAKNTSNTERARAIKLVGNFYKHKFKWSDRCIYCGQPNTELDHVYPVALLANLNIPKGRAKRIIPRGLYLVPSCSECNRLAADRPFASILDKRSFIQSKLRERYQKQARTVMWDEEELSELGRGLRDQVKKMLHNREVVTNRIMWPHRRYELL